MCVLDQNKLSLQAIHLFSLCSLFSFWLLPRLWALNPVSWSLRGQAEGSWGLEQCCAVPGNDCNTAQGHCRDHTSTGNFIFRLGPGDPERFEAINPPGAGEAYQECAVTFWPTFGYDAGWHADMFLGHDDLGGWAYCHLGHAYRGSDQAACGGDPENPELEVWYLK